MFQVSRATLCARVKMAWTIKKKEEEEKNTLHIDKSYTVGLRNELNGEKQAAVQRSVNCPESRSRWRRSPVRCSSPC